jgi:uncharacterized protein
MLIENSFQVPAELDRVWSYLLDVPNVVPCMPGAELTDTIDDANYRGRVTIKLGPVSMAFAGKISIAERDDDTHRMVLKGSGMEQRGKGAASATITTTAERGSGGTVVTVVQDLKVQGQAASLSRGMMQDVSAKLTKQFAECLEANLRAGEGAPEEEGASEGRMRSAEEGAAVGATRPGLQEGSVEGAGPPRQAATGGEIKGLGLGISALAGAVRRFFARLFRPQRRP